MIDKKKMINGWKGQQQRLRKRWKVEMNTHKTTLVMIINKDGKKLK